MAIQLIALRAFFLKCILLALMNTVLSVNKKYIMIGL